MRVQASPRTAVLLLVAASVFAWKVSVQRRSGAGGIGVNAAMAVLLAALGAWLLWKRYRG